MPVGSATIESQTPGSLRAAEAGCGPPPLRGLCDDSFLRRRRDLEADRLLAVLVEEVEHALQIRRDDVAMRAARYFNVVMFDAQFLESGNHAS